MKKVRKILALGIAAVMSMALFAACGGGETEATASMYVSVCNSYVADESLQAFSDELFAAHPDWAEGETPVTVEAISMGSDDIDGTAYGAAIMQVTARAATKELDIMICDERNAARNAHSDLFYLLDEIFTEEEIARFGETLSYEMVDTDGNPTGEWTPACGVKISSPALDAIYGSGEYGIFIVGSTTHLDQAKEVFLALTAQ